MPKDLHELPKLRDGLSYLFVQHCRIEQEAQAIALWDKEGVAVVPAAALGVLMLGPGTAITHAAVKALVENGCSITWVGDEGVRCYAQGMGETRKAYSLLKQAELFGRPEKRMEVIWRMYEKRFGYRLDHTLSPEQVRGMEGARMRDVYAEMSEAYGVPWSGRSYATTNWAASDPINRAISAANACLNGICHAAIVSGGYSPAIGFVHVGRQLSFVYDIADLYKTEITIPLAFQVTAESEYGVETRARYACRDAFRAHRLLQRLLPDIEELLDVPTSISECKGDPDGPASPTGELWTQLWPQAHVQEESESGNELQE